MPKLESADAGFAADAPHVVEVTHTLDATASQVWMHLADHGGWDTWYPGMSRCEAEGGGGPGATRTIELGRLVAHERWVIWEPEHRLGLTVTWMNLPLATKVLEVLEIEPVLGGPTPRVRVRYTGYFRPHLLARFTFRRARQQIEASWAAALAALAGVITLSAPTGPCRREHEYQLLHTIERVELSDFVPSPNQLAIEQYEIENEGFDRQGLVLDAMRALAPWAGRTLLDLGCGSGFWLTKYDHAARVIGVEPDERLVAVARDRVADHRVDGVEVLLGSAEHIPLPDASVDVVHARFAYFFPPGVDAGFDEVMRVLRPGGTLVVVDNDLRHGEFAELVVGSAWAAPQGQASSTDEWWLARGARRTEVMSDWSFDTRDDLATVMRLELPGEIADRWLRGHPDRRHITYGYVLFAASKPGP